MKTRLAQLWDALWSTFWFLPSVMTVLAIGAAFGMIALDGLVEGEAIESLAWIYANRPDGARELLSTVAGSMITVAGVVFSITIVALALAAQQLGPRLLRSFMRDKGNQAVLGTFVATFVYCLLVLRTIHGDGEEGFVPHLAVAFGVLLAVVSLLVLIFFIHHVSASIQADKVIAVVSRDLESAIHRLFPEHLGHEPDGAPLGLGGAESNREADPAPDGLPERFAQAAVAVPAGKSGYLQAVDGESLVELATERDLVLRLRRRPGDFVVEGRTLAEVWPGERIDAAIVEEVADAFIVGEQRTLPQDAEFAIDQLVQVAIRALSPSLNDAFTAMTCVDHLGAALSSLAERRLPSPRRRDQTGGVRVVADVTGFAGLVNAAFDQIRQNSRTNAAVTIRLLESLAGVAEHTRNETQRAALLRQARMVAEGAREAIPHEADRADVEERYGSFLRALEESRARPSAETEHRRGRPEDAREKALGAGAADSPPRGGPGSRRAAKPEPGG